MSEADKVDKSKKQEIFNYLVELNDSELIFAAALSIEIFGLSLTELKETTENRLKYLEQRAKEIPFRIG